MAALASIFADEPLGRAELNAASPLWQTVQASPDKELLYLPPMVTESDYPAEARRQEMEGTVLIGFTVHASGDISDCHVVRSSGLLQLDDASCPLFLRTAQFKPRFREGTVPLRAPIRWQLLW